jgi:hypothetical protein
MEHGISMRQRSLLKPPYATRRVLNPLYTKPFNIEPQRYSGCLLERMRVSLPVGILPDYTAGILHIYSPHCTDPGPFMFTAPMIITMMILL